MTKIAHFGAAALSLLSCAAFARPMTQQDLATLRRVSAPAVSPDGRLVAYQLRETDIEANKGRMDIWLIDSVRRIAPRKIAGIADKNETSPQFSADGKWVYFLSDQSGTSQVWRVSVTGGEAETVTASPVDLSGFLLSPPNNRIAVWADRPEAVTDLAAAPDAPKGGSARIYDKLFIRHWDTWATGERSKLFTYALENGKAVGEAKLVSRGLIGDTPSKPHGGGEEIAWRADGQDIYFALREAGENEAISTNLDLFVGDPDGGDTVKNITKDNQATDTLPAASPDGKWLAWAAMKRPTYEADRQVIQLGNIKTNSFTALAADWDVSVESLTWSADSKSLLVTARDNFDKPLFRVDVPSGKITRLTREGTVGDVAADPKGGAVVTLESLTAPADLFHIDLAGKATRLTSVNADKLADITLPRALKFSFKGAGGDTVWGYQVDDIGMVAAKSVPVAFLVHGGPQSTFGNAWSYRWNPAVFAGAGYAAILIDFHGSTGHGQAFTDSINQDWGGKPFEDIKLGLAAAEAQFPWINANNACALGGSYGGYMMSWIAGNWPDKFKCIVNHAGITDSRSMSLTTEELWFDEWDQGGPWWKRTNPEKYNPINHIAKWKTPMLVTQGEKDYRVPYSQSIMAFTALQRLNVPSRLVMFPDENHWILKPRNSIQWYDEVLGWLGKWTKGGGEGVSSR